MPRKRSRGAEGSFPSERAGQPTAWRLDFLDQFREDIRHWARSDRQVAERLYDLIEAITTDPFRGIGKPEPLKGDLAGAWSRRRTDADRVVYRVHADRVEFIQARYHC